MHDYSITFPSICQLRPAKYEKNPLKEDIKGDFFAKKLVKMHENEALFLGGGCKTMILKNFSKTPCIFGDFGIKYIIGKGGKLPDRFLPGKKFI